jgi:rare lipoprotein A
MFWRILLILLCYPVAHYGQHVKPKKEVKEGIASYYHAKFNGRKTATGEIFSNQNMTAASNHFPLGTMVKVTNKKTGKFVFVKINDRMAASNHRIIDLTEKAAKELCFMDKGICVVTVEKTNGKSEEIILSDEKGDSLSTK